MSLLNGPNEGNWSVFAEKVVAERDEARAEVRRLRDALLRYGDHDSECYGAVSTRNRECVCGLDAVFTK